MTKKLNFLMISVLAAIGVFIYLTIHHYAIKLGLSDNTFCSVSETINCDAAALSSYAEIAGIPISILGGVFQVILLGFTLFARLGWTDTSIYTKMTVRTMLVFAAAVSLVMATLSIVSVKVICPFCVATYILSFISLALGWNAFETDDEPIDWPQYFSTYKSHLILLALVPIFSWVFASMIQENYGLNELKKLVPEKIAQWKNNAEQEIDPATGIHNGGTSTHVVLVEYADFKCPHCRDASKTFETFAKANPTAQMIMKPFPLDGTCNASPNMHKGDGTRCTLAAWALCADKIAKKGWLVQKWLFAKQDEIGPATDLKPFLVEIEKEFQLNATELTTCSDSSETYDLIKKITEEGIRVQVTGTPTIYLNRKKLPYGNILEVLKTAASEIR